MSHSSFSLKDLVTGDITDCDIAGATIFVHPDNKEWFEEGWEQTKREFGFTTVRPLNVFYHSKVPVDRIEVIFHDMNTRFVEYGEEDKPWRDFFDFGVTRINHGKTFFILDRSRRKFGIETRSPFSHQPYYMSERN